MSRLGRVLLHIEQEDIDNPVTITAYPVEKGEPIADHVQIQPRTLNLTGYLLSGPTQYKADAAYLINASKAGTPLRYVGRTVAGKVLVTNVHETKTGSVDNGEQITIDLQYFRVVTIKWTKTKAKAKPKKKTVGKKKKTVNKKSSKKYVKVKRGNTYWGMMMKYGTPVSTLERWNPWPARRIPIGVMMRVK